MNRAEALQVLGAALVGASTDGVARGRPIPEGVPCQLNVRDFGAQGDGKTDDTDAVQRAIAHAAAKSTPVHGGRLCFPAGTYRVGPLTASAHCLALVGEGWTNTRLVLRGGANGTLLTINGVPNINFTGVRIESMELDGNGPQQSGASRCLHIASVWNCVLGPGLALRNARSDGLLCSDGCVQNWCHGLYVENCGGYGVHAVGIFQQFNIVDSIVQWNRQGGICYEPAAVKMGGHISHNYFEGIPDHEQPFGVVVKANQYQSMEIHNNIFNQMSTAAVWLRAGTRSVSLKRNLSSTTGGPHAVIIEPGSYGHVGELNDWDKPVSGPLPTGVVAGMSADRGDVDVVLQSLRDQPTQRFASRLTAPRRVTLSREYAYNGARFRIVRTGAGFPLGVLGEQLTPAQWMDVEFDGEEWHTVARGDL